MFGLFNKKIQLVAPASGKVIALGEVPDPVFAQKAVGDGVAMAEISSDLVGAPIDGTVELIFHTNHAFIVKTKDGIEVMVHIGINTVELEGRGFERLIEQGQSVKAGEPIIRIDRQLISDAGFSLVTPVVITSPDLISDLEGHINQHVSGGRDIIMVCKKK